MRLYPSRGNQTTSKHESWSEGPFQRTPFPAYQAFTSPRHTVRTCDGTLSTGNTYRPRGSYVCLAENGTPNIEMWLPVAQTSTGSHQRPVSSALGPAAAIVIQSTRIHGQIQSEEACCIGHSPNDVAQQIRAI